MRRVVTQLGLRGHAISKKRTVLVNIDARMSVCVNQPGKPESTRQGLLRAGADHHPLTRSAVEQLTGKRPRGHTATICLARRHREDCRLPGTRADSTVSHDLPIWAVVSPAPDRERLGGEIVDPCAHY
jgi:hypothetical protein